MRTIILILHVVSFGWLRAYSQSCQQEQPKNQHRIDLVEGFIWQSQQSKFMTHEKGIALLEQETDSLGREVWTLTPYMDDSYREAKSLPRSYYNIKGYIILIWKKKNIRINLWIPYRDNNC